MKRKPKGARLKRARKEDTMATAPGRAKGPRPENDPSNIEGSGYNYHDKVTVLSDNKKVNGHIEAIHSGGRKLDVRIDHPGHSAHGRIVTFDPSEVEAHGELLDKLDE
jgi:hypothetical protein